MAVVRQGCGGLARVGFVVALLGAACPTSATAQSGSQSIGHSASGRLIDGVPLSDSTSIQTYERRARYGTAEMVAMLRSAADSVQRTHADSPPLTVGDLSRRRGGAFPPHRSHRNGRDVDVGFYYLDAAGEPMVAPRFVAIRRDGRCTTPGGAPCRLDVVRTWSLLAAMLPADTAVQYMLMAPHIRSLLLAEARRAGADAALVRRFRMVSLSTAQSRAHVNHVHVRLYCAPDDRPRCVDPPPHLPWYVFPEGTDATHVSAARERIERRLREDANLEARAQARRAQLEARMARLRARDEAQRAARAARRERARARLAAAEEAEAEARSERRRRAQARAERAAAEAEAARRQRAQRRERARARVAAARAEAAAQRARARARRQAHVEREAAEAARLRAIRRARREAMAEAEAERLRLRAQRRASRRSGP